MRSSFFASALVLTVASADQGLSVATLLEEQMNSYDSFDAHHGFDHPYVDVHPMHGYHHGAEYLHHEGPEYGHARHPADMDHDFYGHDHGHTYDEHDFSHYYGPGAHHDYDHDYGYRDHLGHGHDYYGHDAPHHNQSNKFKSPMVYKAEHDIPGPFGSLKPMRAPMDPDIYEEIFEHYYMNPYGSELPSPGLYGSRGPFYDKTTFSGDKKTSLPAAKPDLQKQVPRYPGETREDFWETQEESVKDKMKWDKEIQKF